MSRGPFLVPRVATLLAALLAWAAPQARAEEPTREQMAEHAVRSLFDGQWEHAERWFGAWLSGNPFTLDMDLPPLGSWRTAWSLPPDGRLAPASDLGSIPGAGDPSREAVELLLDPARDLANEAGRGRDFGPITLLWYERAWRESLGMVRGPTTSPLKLLPDPSGAMARFLAWQREVQEPASAEASSDAAWAAKARGARLKADHHRGTARLTGWLAGLGLLALTLLAGAWLGRRPRQG